jgi:sigma-B regulation protein RsbQ
VQVVGRGARPMVFAHGFGCDQNMWRYVVPAFADEYRVVLFDYVGSGAPTSPRTTPRATPRSTATPRTCSTSCGALDLRDVVFVGHSVSAMVGVLAANREPGRFARLVLVGPSPRYLNDPPDYVGGFERADIEGLLETMDRNYMGWANFLAPAVMQNGDRPELARSSPTASARPTR